MPKITKGSAFDLENYKPLCPPPGKHSQQSRQSSANRQAMLNSSDPHIRAVGAGFVHSLGCVPEPKPERAVTTRKRGG